MTDDLISVPRWALQALSSAGLAQVAVLTIKRHTGWNGTIPTVRVDGGPPQPVFVDDEMLDELKRAVRMAKDSLARESRSHPQ